MKTKGLTVFLTAAILAAAFVSSCTTNMGSGAPGTRSVTPAQDVTSAERNGNGLTLSLGDDRLLVDVPSDGILRVRFLPGGEADAATTVLDPSRPASLGPSGEVVIDSSSDPLTIRTAFLYAEISRHPCTISLFDAHGELLLRETPSKDLRFTHASGDNFYGIHGFNATEQSSALLLRNAGGQVSAGMQGNAGGPLVWSTSGYGILVDSDGGTWAADGTALSFTGGSRRDAEHFLLVGAPTVILESVSRLTGPAPMFPKWAMGFMNSEWGIDQGELLSLVEGYRSRNLPLDCFILDFDWKAWGADNYGEWRWNAQNFPDGRSGKLAADMNALGVRLVGIMKPRIHTETVQGRYAGSRGFWLPARRSYNDYFSGRPVNDLDFSTEDCRLWFFDHFRESFDAGIAGWWNDEADGFNNFEFMNMQRSLYEGQRAYSEKRVFSLNRNFYTGSQRYAYGLWSGDIPTGFPSMARQRERMLSAVNLGEAKWGMDIGGFIGTPSPENYARWMQFGAFVPVFRVHGTRNEQRQPWAYGVKAEAAARKAMELRYRLIPYIYSYERRAYETGIGLVKPLCVEFPDDPAAANLVDSWLFGDWLLVSPVVEQGRTVKRVYLPRGTWIDYFTGKRYEGGRTIDRPIDAETWKDFPLFVRLGAIIPTQEPMGWTGEKPVRQVYVDVFPAHKTSSFVYYDDDGETYGYERGEYFRQRMETGTFDGNTAFEIGEREGSRPGELEYYLCRIHTGDAPGRITVNGEPVPTVPRAASLELVDGEAAATAGDVYGTVVTVKVRAGERKVIGIAPR